MYATTPDAQSPFHEDDGPAVVVATDDVVDRVVVVVVETDVLVEPDVEVVADVGDWVVVVVVSPGVVSTVTCTTTITVVFAGTDPGSVHVYCSRPPVGMVRRTLSAVMRPWFVTAYEICVHSPEYNRLRSIVAGSAVSNTTQCQRTIQSTMQHPIELTDSDDGIRHICHKSCLQRKRVCLRKRHLC